DFVAGEKRVEEALSPALSSKGGEGGEGASRDATAIYITFQPARHSQQPAILPPASVVREARAGALGRKRRLSCQRTAARWREANPSPGRAAKSLNFKFQASGKYESSNS